MHLRTLGLAVAVFVVGAGTVAAGSADPGTVKSIDADKNTITVTFIDGKDYTFSVEKTTKIVQPGATKKAPLQDVTGGLSGLKVGQNVLMTRDKKDGKEVLTEIKLLNAKKK